MIKFKTLQKRIKLIKLAKKNNYQLLTSASSALKAVINIAYMVFNGVMGIVYLSLWNGSICVYYLLLGLIRLLVVRAERKKFPDQAQKKNFRRKVYIRTHLLLLLMDIAMITPAAVMVNGGRSFAYGLIPAIAMAAYTTYRITSAIMHFVKTRKSGNLLVSELRLVNLTDALLAILTLQNALIIANDGFSAQMKTLMMWSSGTILAVIFCLTILSVLKAAGPGKNARSPAS